MHRIEQSLGQRLPLAALLQAPTVEQFAELLRQERLVGLVVVAGADSAGRFDAHLFSACMASAAT